KPLAAELGLSRAAVSLAAGLARLEGGFASPPVGWLSDRFGPRWVILVGTCVMVIGLALMNFINSFWAFILVWGTIAIGHSLGHTIAPDKAITNWFVKKRGLALGTRFLLWGLGGVITLPIASWLVTTQGWRITCLIWAGIIFATLPLVWFLIKPNRPEYYGLLPDGATIGEEEADTNRMIDKGVEYAAETEEVEFTLRQAMKTRSYWMLLLAWSSGMIIMGGIGIHTIPFLTDMGIDPFRAASMMAMMQFFSLPSRFFGGLLADRIRRDRLQYLLAGTFLLMAAGITVFLLKQTIAMVYVFFVLYGFGNGAATPLRLMIGSRYFGRKAFGTILGSILVIEAPLGFLAPVYAGWIYDTTGSYITAFTVFAILAAFATLLMFLVQPPKPPAEVTDIHKFM
ncbi:MFS transporter, partial [Chloroflexota bacterium]